MVKNSLPQVKENIDYESVKMALVENEGSI